MASCKTCDHDAEIHSKWAGCVAAHLGDFCPCTKFVPRQHHVNDLGLTTMADRKVAEITQARQLRDDGAAAAGSAVPTALESAWRDMADKAMAVLIKDQVLFSAEQVRAVAGEPPHPNMLGALFLRWQKAGRIKPEGYTQATHRAGHARILRTWRGS